MKAILAAVAAIFLAGAANASQITILSINSGWEVESLVDTYNRNALLTGEGTNTIRWGKSFPGYSGRSGFRFEETSVGTSHDANTLFNVGVFTHLNRVIYMGEHLDVARLNMQVTASFDGIVKTFNTSYRFSLWETPNYDNPCANGEKNNLSSTGAVTGQGSLLNQNGCADRVMLLTNDAKTDSFTVNGLTYTFQLFGFDSGPVFWTIEDRDNHTWLKAVFNVEGLPPVSEIPLPAGVWLLLGGLAGLGLMRRRKLG
jgi:hypothetical protein